MPVGVLRHHHGAGLLGPIEYGLPIQGLDGEAVHHRHGHALLLQGQGRLHGFVEHDPRGEDHRVGALPQGHGLADDELAAVLVHLRQLLAAHPDVLDPRAIDALPEDALEAGGVGHVDHRAAGQDAVEGHVLEGHVGAAVHGRRDAGIRADHRDIVLAVAAGEEDLVVAAAGREGTEGVDDGPIARHGQARGHAGHVALGDAAVDGAVRVLSGPFQRAGAAHQIRVQIDGVLVLGHDLFNCGPKDLLAEALVHFTGIYDLHSHPSNAARSACSSPIQRAYRSSLMGMLWFISVFSASAMPWPFTVSSTMA